MGRQPIDQGWSWLVCLGTGVQAFFVIGGAKTLGVLFVEILEIFDSPATVSSLTLGLGAGGFAVIAMMSNALYVMVGSRVVVLGGAVIFSMSILLSAYPANVWQCIVFLGFTSGIAMGAMLTPSIILLTMYFDKRRSFANGLALAGSSVGQLVLPYLMTWIIGVYGYSGGMLIYTAITINAIPAAMLLRPVHFWHRPHARRDTGDVKAPSQSALDSNSVGECKKEDPDTLGPEVCLDMTRPLNDKEAESRSDLPWSTLEYGSVSMLPGVSVESINQAAVLAQSQADLGSDRGRKVGCIRVKPLSMSAFCHAMFDRDLLRSPCLWLLFFGVGLGQAGFLNVILHFPVLGVELFHSKFKGALLVTVVGVFDLVGRVGGGWFADQNYMTRSSIILMGFVVSGSSTLLATIYPCLEVLLTYCVLLGVFGGLYRILLPVITGDLFGPQKVGPGISMLFMSLGLIILPVPTLLGFIQEQCHSYLPAYQLCGALLLFGAVMIIILKVVSRYDQAVVKTNSPALEVSPPEDDQLQG